MSFERRFLFSIKMFNDLNFSQTAIGNRHSNLSSKIEKNNNAVRVRLDALRPQGKRDRINVEKMAFFANASTKALSTIRPLS